MKTLARTQADFASRRPDLAGNGRGKTRRYRIMHATAVISGLVGAVGGLTLIGILAAQ
jgi:hypothetical protein